MEIETFVCFDNRVFLRPETYIIDFAINTKECSAFPTRVNLTLFKNDTTHAAGVSRELHTLVGVAEKLFEKDGGCIAPLFGNTIIIQ